MSSLPNPTFETACARCLGRGYLPAARGDFAQAEPCECTSACRTCGGSGRSFTQRDGALFATPCRCRETLRRIGLYNRARIPRHFGEKGFDRFKPYQPTQAHALRAIQNLSQSYPKTKKG
ncbi:MAG: hypothetical protein ACYCWW_10320, partial [Deltaproteobacteria bacterium]